jgi:hypothetical protein
VEALVEKQRDFACRTLARVIEQLPGLLAICYGSSLTE